MVDGNGNITATYYYDAFGNILDRTGDIENNIRFSGYQYDEETGFYYLNARMYNPATARFLQEDTYRGNTSIPLSLNLYTYCSNEPIMYRDPTGHWKEGDELLSKGNQWLIEMLTEDYYKAEKKVIPQEWQAQKKGRIPYVKMGRIRPVLIT